MNREERLALDGCDNPVLFYRPSDAWGCFSNFSRHVVVLPHPFLNYAVTYATSEHRYQAMKATTVEDHDFVAAAYSAAEAKDRGRRIALRASWDFGTSYEVMVEAVAAKTAQHAAVGRALRETGDRMIYEDSPVDDIWGWRFHESYTGENLLGKALMEVRSSL